MLTMLGCGGTADYDGDERAAVQGNVTLNGQPLAAGSITFRPLVLGGRIASTAITNGEYVVEEAKGPNLGSYSVEIYATTGDTGLAGEDPNAKAVKQPIPAKFNTQTTLQVEIVSGENTHDFPLTGS